MTADGALLTGGTTPAVTVTTPTQGGGDATTYGMDLWHEDTFNVASRPMLLKVPSKDSAGHPRDLLIGLYRVDFAPITFDGPAYKDGLKVNYNGTAVLSLYDEVGAAFSDGKKRAGRLISVGKTAPA
jgi:hypothetical protein